MYYQVKSESDQVRLPLSKTGGILVKHELYTEREMTIHGLMNMQRHFTKIEVSKNDTHFFFGARFMDADTKPAILL